MIHLSTETRRMSVNRIAINESLIGQRTVMSFAEASLGQGFVAVVASAI